MKLSPAQRRLLEEVQAGKRPIGRYRASAGALLNRRLIFDNPKHWVTTQTEWGTGRRRNYGEPEYVISDAGREALA